MSRALTFVLNEQQSKLCLLIDWHAEYFSGQNIMRLPFIYLCIVIRKWLLLIYSKAAGDAMNAMMFIFPFREVNKTSMTGLLITGHQEKRIIGLIVHLCFSRRLKSDKALKHKTKSCFLCISWWQCNAITVLLQGTTNQGWFESHRGWWVHNEPHQNHQLLFTLEKICLLKNNFK